MSNISGKRKIKVAYALTPVDFGGAEKVSLNFLRNFNTDQFEIVPILLIRPWERGNFFIQEIEKHKINYLTIPVAIKPSNKGRDYFRIIRCYQRLFLILKQGNFDLVHTNGYFADILGVPLSKFFHIPLVATCHGFIQNDRKLRSYNKIDIFLLKFSSKIISVATDLKEKLVSLGVPESKVLTIGNAVELPKLTQEEFLEKRFSVRKRFDFNDDDIVIGYVGRLSEEKGVKYLLAAGKELLKNGLKVKFLLIGDGPQKLELETITRNLGLQEFTIFTGFQKHVVNLLPALNIFVLPSLTEGTPMALLEAMSYGIPVVATHVGGIPKVINNEENGILIPPSNDSELAASILKLLNSKKLQEKLSNGARKSIKERYSLKNWIKAIEQLYMELTIK